MTKSYQWYYDGAAIPGATGKTHTLTSGQTDSDKIECRVEADYGADGVAALAEYEAAGFADPTSLGAKLIAWWDLSDSSNIYSDAGGTTGITDTDVIANVTDKSGNGNTLLAVGGGGYSGTGPTWSLSKGAAEYAGSQRLGASSISGLTTTMECHALINAVTATETGGGLVGTADNSVYAGLWEDGNTAGGDLDAGAGSPTYEYGSPGASAGSTRDSLHTNWITGAKAVASAIAIDMSTNSAWGTTLAPITYNTTAFGYTGDLHQFVLTTALTPQERTDLQAWLAAQ